MITFERYSATHLYRISSASPGGDGYLAFYLIAGDAADTLSLADTWHTAVGYYVFLAQEPADHAALAGALDGFFAGYKPVRTGWAWLHFTPDGDPAVEGTVVHSAGEASGAGGAEPAKSQLHSCALDLLQQAVSGTVEPPSEDTPGFTIALPSVAAKADSGQADSDHEEPVFPGDVHLPLSGPNRGCIMGKVAVGDFSGSQWNVGLYYFVQGASSIVSQYYPLINVYPQIKALFAMSFDPLAPLDPERTYLQFTGSQKMAGQGKADPSLSAGEQPLPPFVMDSKFRTVYGERIGLLPVGAPPPPGKRGARLVQQPLPSGGYYVTLDGDFMITLLSENLEVRSGDSTLLPGVSGLESIAVRGHTETVEGNYLSFFPFCPAYVPVFPLLKPGTQQPAASAGDIQPLITDKYVTAWMTVGPALSTGGPSAGSPVQYFSQPDGAALYSEESRVEGSGDFLSYFAATAALLPAPEQATSFPMAPVAGAIPATTEFGPEFIRNLELQILSPFRRERIRQFTSDPGTGEEKTDTALHYGTTPQGLLAKVSDFQWKELLLASNTDTKSGAVQSLAFTDLNPTLQAAFQTNQQFLVITKDTFLKEDGTAFHNTISIEGWPFFIDVGLSTVGNYRNVMIFKFGEGSVAERVRDVRLWTDPAHFNSTDDDNLQKLSNWLVAYIGDARKRAAHDEAFAHFVNIVDNPMWNGILALNVTIGLSDFPPELKGLLAGIDLERFSAHHFGIDVNFVQPDGGGGLQMAPQSSMFALIDYVDESLSSPEVRASDRTRRSPTREVAAPRADDFPPYYAQPYEFVVLTLQVVFANSEIQNFTSTIKLTINELFGEAVRNPDNSDDPDANAIILDGSYEDHSGSKSYVFNIRESIYFRFVGKVVDHVEILKAQFSTLQSVPVPGSDTDEIVQSRFSFWGTMGFYNVADDFDLFSFDSLSYTGMYVDMSFALSAPDKAVFGFNPAAMTFDPAGSRARANSVFKNFPLQLQGVVYNGNSTGRPTDMGFLQVKTPLTGYSNSVDNTWFALSCTINLGTPGALAASIGLTARLYAVWSPVFDPRSSNAIAVNISLPRGGGGNNQLSLQGVLQLAIRSIRFNTTFDEDTGNRAFLLVFERIALRVLGLNLPTNATLDAVLFGNPDPDSTPGSLGWYFAYNKTTAPAALAAPKEQKQLPMKSEVQ